MSVARSGLLAFAPLCVAACNMDSSPALQDPTTGTADTGTELVPVRQAIQQAEIAGSDLGTMNGAEVRKVVQPGPHCSFSYVEGGRPVFVTVPAAGGAARGYAKLHGHLVELTAAPPVDLSRGGTFRADAMAVALAPVEGGSAAPGQLREADLVFLLRQGLRVGYGGFYRCASDGLPGVH